MPYQATSKLCVAANLVRRIMVEKGYGVNAASDLLFCILSVFTYFYCSSIKMPALLGLCDPHCRLIQPIRIDLDYIEVLPSGTCFHIPTKSFIVNPNISGSPRAFVEYTYKEDVVPLSHLFVEGKLQFVSFCELI